MTITSDEMAAYLELAEKALPRDADNDGRVYDNTPREQPAPRRLASRENRTQGALSTGELRGVIGALKAGEHEKMAKTWARLESMTPSHIRATARTLADDTEVDLVEVTGVITRFQDHFAEFAAGGHHEAVMHGAEAAASHSGGRPGVALFLAALEVLAEIVELAKAIRERHHEIRHAEKGLIDWLELKKHKHGGHRKPARYDPNARDADADRIVQEGTPYARPARPSVSLWGGLLPPGESLDPPNRTVVASQRRIPKMPKVGSPEFLDWVNNNTIFGGITPTEKINDRNDSAAFDDEDDYWHAVAKYMDPRDREQEAAAEQEMRVVARRITDKAEADGPDSTYGKLANRLGLRPVRASSHGRYSVLSQGRDEPVDLPEDDDPFRARLSPEMAARYDAADEAGKQAMRSALPEDPFEGIAFHRGGDQPVDLAVEDTQMQRIEVGDKVIHPTTGQPVTVTMVASGGEFKPNKGKLEVAFSSGPGFDDLDALDPIKRISMSPKHAARQPVLDYMNQIQSSILGGHGRGMLGVAEAESLDANSIVLRARNRPNAYFIEQALQKQNIPYLQTDRDEFRVQVPGKPADFVPMASPLRMPRHRQRVAASQGADAPSDLPMDFDELRKRPIRDRDGNPGVNVGELAFIMGAKTDAERDDIAYWLQEDGGADTFDNLADELTTNPITGKPRPVTMAAMVPGLQRAYADRRREAAKRGIVYPSGWDVSGGGPAYGPQGQRLFSQGTDKPSFDINSFLDNLGKTHGSVPATGIGPGGAPAAPAVLGVTNAPATPAAPLDPRSTVFVAKDHKGNWVARYRRGDIFYNEKLDIPRSADMATARAAAASHVPEGYTMEPDRSAVASLNLAGVPTPGQVPDKVLGLTVPVPKDMAEVKTAVASLKAEFGALKSGREYFPAESGTKNPSDVAFAREEKLRAIGAGIDALVLADPNVAKLNAASDAARNDYKNNRDDAHRKAWWDATAAAGRAYGEATRALLDQVRPMGTGGDATKIDNFDTQGDAKLSKVVATAAEFYPSEWLDTAHSWKIDVQDKQTGGKGLAGAGGYFATDHRGTGTIYLEDPKPATAAHEMGHLMERTRRALAQAEWTFLMRRTNNGRPHQDTQYRTLAYQDEFMDHYIGATYLPASSPGYRAKNYEAFTRGMEWVSGYGKMMRSLKPDPDYRAFMVGVLAVM